MHDLFQVFGWMMFGFGSYVLFLIVMTFYVIDRLTKNEDLRNILGYICALAPIILVGLYLLLFL